MAERLQHPQTHRERYGSFWSLAKPSLAWPGSALWTRRAFRAWRALRGTHPQVLCSEDLKMARVHARSCHPRIGVRSQARLCASARIWIFQEFALRRSFKTKNTPDLVVMVPSPPEAQIGASGRLDGMKQSLKIYGTLRSHCASLSQPRSGSSGVLPQGCREARQV